MTSSAWRRLHPDRHRRPHRCAERRQRRDPGLQDRRRRPARSRSSSLLSPQLPLEAAMLAQGGFRRSARCIAEELIYLSLAGEQAGAQAAPHRRRRDAGGRSGGATARPHRLVRRSRHALSLRACVPYRADIAGDYDHLARVREWSPSGWRRSMMRDRLHDRLRPGHLRLGRGQCRRGKTYTLANRVARLLLADARPQKILCLTFTKAAAAEMQDRLFQQLGEWSMLPDDELRDDIIAIGGEAHADLPKARRLFAGGAGNAGRVEGADPARLLPDRAVALSHRGRHSARLRRAGRPDRRAR